MVYLLIVLCSTEQDAGAMQFGQPIVSKGLPFRVYVKNNININIRQDSTMLLEHALHCHCAFLEFHIS